MSYWKNIYDFADKILKKILSEDNTEAGQTADETVEYVSARLSKEGYFSARMSGQEKYDPLKGYRKFCSYRRRRRIVRYRIAAGIIFLLSFGTWAFYLLHPDPVIEKEAIVPGGKKAVLTLSDGSVWHLRDTVMTIRTSREVFKVDSGHLSVKATEGILSDTAINCNVVVPRGGEFHLTLADGSEIWLNSESEIQYPLYFGKRERRVRLKGEAYLEITKNEHCPFIVEAEQSEIKVLGTCFNVRCYEDEKQVVTTLVEGAVCLSAGKKTVVLDPGEQGVWDKNISLIKRKVDIYPYVAWRENKFVFRKQKLEDIMKVVSRWYNVEVHFEDLASREISFSGTAQRYDGFASLVEMLQATGSIACKIEKNAIYIRKR